MHINLYLAEKRTGTSPLLSKLCDLTVNRNEVGQYVLLGNLPRVLPDGLAAEEAKGTFGSCDIQANGSANVPLEGEYDYTDLPERFYATVEISGGFWYLNIQAPTFDLARAAWFGIRTGTMRPTARFEDVQDDTPKSEIDLCMGSGGDRMTSCGGGDFDSSLIGHVPPGKRVD